MRADVVKSLTRITSGVLMLAGIAALANAAIVSWYICEPNVTCVQASSWCWPANNPGGCPPGQQACGKCNLTASEPPEGWFCRKARMTDFCATDETPVWCGFTDWGTCVAGRGPCVGTCTGPYVSDPNNNC